MKIEEEPQSTTKDLSLFTLTDPKQVRLLYGAIESLRCINYVIHKEEGRLTGIEFVLDIEDERLAPLLEALQKG